MTEMEVAPVKGTITLQVFGQIDIRVGTIKGVADVEGSNKLVRLTVSFGNFRRSILAGMKGERGDPAEIVGRQALFLVNLEPKRMMGQVSDGMLLDIGYADDQTSVLAVPERPVPPGARLG